MGAEDRDDKEVTFNISSDPEVIAAQKLAEGEEQNTPEAILARQAKEAGLAEGEEEDRGDVFEPDAVDGDKAAAQGAELSAEELAAAQALLGVEAEQEPGKPLMIPKFRFDEVNKKMREATQRADLLEVQLAAAKTIPEVPEGEAFDFDAKELEYMNALTEEGDQEKALAIRKEIRAAERDLLKGEARGNVTAATVQQGIDAAFQEVITSSVELYPFLDSTSATKNPAAIQMVVALRNQHISEGKNPATALSLAVGMVGPLFSVQGADETAPEKTEAQKRAEESLKRGADASRQQPHNVARLGEQPGARSINALTMSEAEFDALPEAEKKKARGDEL